MATTWTHGGLFRSEAVDDVTADNLGQVDAAARHPRKRCRPRIRHRQPWLGTAAHTLARQGSGNVDGIRIPRSVSIVQVGAFDPADSDRRIG